MKKEFWHKIWEENKIGFHNQEVNHFLVRHFSKLLLKENDRVFVPLCGKTLDILWLLENGYKVVGAELNKKAIDELFEMLHIKPIITEDKNFTLYSDPDIDIFVGDIFDLDAQILGNIDAVYDRAAIVALPLEMRKKYSSHMKELVNKAPQLLLTLVYDQSNKNGPPFSLEDQELFNHYRDRYNIELLESKKEENFNFDMDEKVWLLNN